MDKDGISGYLPWSDDVLLPGESLYALLNKFGWFACRGPLQLIRDLVTKEGKPSPKFVQSVDFEWGATIWKRIVSIPQFPVIDGLPFDKYIDKLSYEGGKCLSKVDSEKWLRYCPECIALGMHFYVSQHPFLECCPYHGQRLRTHCRECECKLQFLCESEQASFSCPSCKTEFLSPEITDLRGNLTTRLEIARAHAEALKKLALLPNIIYYSRCNVFYPGYDRVRIKRAVTEMMDIRARGVLPPPLRLAAPYFAVTIARNDRNQPSLKRLTSASFELQNQPLNAEQESNIRQLSQLRVGAWALQKFSDHLVCICAARELILKDESRISEFSSNAESHACAIGKGFAVWESGHAVRATQKLTHVMRSAWGLNDRFSELFAHYVMEKGGLGSSIMNFIENDTILLGEWRRKKYDLELINTNFIPESCSKQAMLWLDINLMDISDCCNLNCRETGAQLQWLLDFCENQSSQLESGGQAYPVDLISDLEHKYGAASRVKVSQKWMHDEIDHRVGFTLKSDLSPP